MGQSQKQHLLSPIRELLKVLTIRNRIFFNHEEKINFTLNVIVGYSTGTKYVNITLQQV